ncbi:MAG: UDP-N-acetylglucosamine 2-epimerase [Bacteroidota bacterium]
MRKICVVVTARPSYSRIKTALREIDEHSSLELQLVVAASALLDRYGRAVSIMEKDGFRIAARVFNVLEGENLTAQAKTTGLGILELASVFERLEPDAVVTVADRFETMATAIAASYMNIPLVHIQGGEVTGNIDEKVRHAITKLSDLHLVASERAKERVIKMGEFPEKVFNIGCPSIDIAHQVLINSELDFDIYERYSGVGGKPEYKEGYLVVMQHPVTTEYQMAREHIEETLFAIQKLKRPTFWFWPNVDAGANGTSKGIRSFRERFDCEHIHFFKNMEPDDFLRVLKNSQCLIGNSSVGIRECAYLGIPVVNIGTRQNGRERGANVLDVINYDREQIEEAILRQINNGHYSSDNIYGQGRAGEQIAKVLSEEVFTFTKVLRY